MGNTKDKKISKKKQGKASDVRQDIEETIVKGREIHAAAAGAFISEDTTPNEASLSRKARQLANRANLTSTHADSALLPSALTAPFPKIHHQKKRAIPASTDEYEHTLPPSKKKFNDITPVDDVVVRHGEHVFNDEKPSKRKTAPPEDSYFNNVERPHGGISYNPTPEEHEQVLRNAAEVVQKEEEAKERLSKMLDPMMKRGAYNMIDERIAALMHAEAVNEAVQEIEFEPELAQDTIPAPEKKPIDPEDKLTKRDLRKKAKKAEEEKAKVDRRAGKAQGHQIELAKHMIKEIAADEVKRQQEKDDKAEAARQRKQVKKFGKRRFKHNLEFQLSEDIAGNLRGMQVEGSVLKDRFVSMQKRHLIETRIPSVNKSKVVFTKAQTPMFDPKLM